MTEELRSCHAEIHVVIKNLLLSDIPSVYSGIQVWRKGLARILLNVGFEEIIDATGNLSEV